MDIKRAQEILQAEKTIPVMWNGEPVWIDRVDMSSGQVHVHKQNDPDERKMVSPDELQELH
jgi:H-type small acid-soluble spore protein